ncbi:MAG: urease accessory UreF family protein, partial [Pseudomonadota bacterium]|nr:urease accessory UreF family protein [Pseudomonadota bacterium]
MTGEGAANNGHLLRLMTWLSPAFPVGAYTYSHGLEFAVEDGQVATREDLVAWLRVVLHHGCGRLDGGFFTAAWQATDGDDRAAFEAVAAQADAARASAELALEASAQGAAFLQTVTTVWPTPRLTAWADALRDNDIT